MKKLSRIAALLFLAASCTFAQNVSGSLRAVIIDPSGSLVPSAECVVTNQATGAALTSTADAQGTCNFPIIQAGTYTFSAKASGFKAVETKGIVVTAGETRTLGRLTLEVGAMTEKVTVTADVSQIQLATAEKSGTINQSQLQSIAVRGRDFFALLNTVPGVVDNFSQARETSSPDSIRGTFINGGRENQKNLAIDGITDLDTGSNSTVHFQPNMDSISEIKILTSNYQAEFGRNGGGVITVITKGGSQSIHGTAYDYYRHESLNANSFFNNKDNIKKAPYRYRITGYSIGGPVTIPKVFNKEKDKLFFFWSQEFVGMRKDYGNRYVNMPTEMERNGDFSNSRNSSGGVITIKDPLTGKAFPGNIIPTNRINPLGQAMLKFFPTPNYTEQDPKQMYNRNYQVAYSGAYPKREDLVRIDYNVSPSLQVYWRYVQDKDEQNVPYGLWVNGNTNFLSTPTVFGQPGKGHNVHVQKMFSPTLINEFIFGKSHNNLYFYPKDPSAIDRSKIGNPAQWFKDTGTGVSYLDDMTYMPNLQFGGQPSSVVDARFGNIPYENFNDIYSFVDNVSKVSGKHTFKLGVYLERTRKFQVGGGNNRGAFNFSTNANNSLDTGNSYANAMVGSINSYSEATARVGGDWYFWNLEWYAQDNWRISRKLTLDLGMRFYHLPPQTDKNQTIATFDPSLYSRAKAPTLYMPIMSNGKRVAIDPRTGTLAANPLIGLFVPGSGEVANGAAVGGVNGYPGGLYKVPFLDFGPRIGFAYDAFGNGKTAIRGGFGMFKDRMQGNPTMNTNGNPPVAYSPTLYFGTLDNYANSGGATGPTNVSTLLGDQSLSTTMNWSLGVQQQIAGMAIDASYVGSSSYHLMAQINMNAIPIGARFLKANEDPTQPGKPLADNFLRPYYGWGDINLRTNGYNANYHAFQLAINRRSSHGFQYGISYTFSKTLGVADGDTSGVSPYFSARQRNYGPAGFDRPHVFVVNYVYDTPKIGARLGFKPAQWVLDDWQISGVTTLQSGSPFTPGYSLKTATEVTGSTEGARPDIIGNPQISKDQRDFYHWIDGSAILAPAIGSFGNAGVNTLRNPGVNNWDLAISKRFPLGNEQRFLQFRTETFNTWNHTQYSGIDTGTSFDATGAAGKITNPNFGVINGARSPRNIQLSLKLYF